MKRRLRAALLALLVFLAALPVGRALANYAYRDGNGALQTVVSFVCFSTYICPAQVLMDSTGTEKATPTNPLWVASPLTPVATNPTSVLTLPSTTSAYSIGQLIANSATAGSVVVPSFLISNNAGAAAISRLRLSTNNSTSTAWGGVTVQVDLWTAAPTWTNGDRGTWSPATGTANHLATFSCVMSAEYGDGAFAECAPSVGTFALPKLPSGASVYWSLMAKTASGVTGASKAFTLTAELVN